MVDPASEIRRALSVSIAEGLINAVNQAEKVRSRQLKILAEALSAEAIPAGRRKQAHQEIGLAAQRSTVQAYTHRKNKRRAGTYRTNTRFAGGALLRALQASDFFEVTPNGLGFINTQRLNQEARQWRRLNFGAGQRAGARPARFEVEWSGLLVATLGLEPDPRPAFGIPPGYWIGNRPGGQFFPTRRRPLRTTEGIEATNFLDAGVRRIAQELGPTYQRMYRDFYNNALQRNRVSQRVGVTAPRPRTNRIRVTRFT